MRKIILNIAISLDGFIADPGGGFEWIQGHRDSTQDTDHSFDFSTFVQSVDTIVMGSIAYEDCPKETLESFQNHRVIVATKRNFATDDRIEFFQGDIVDHIQSIQKQDGKDIWLFGGAGLAAPFIKANVIDEYIIGIIPIILGDGRPLFIDSNPIIPLHLDTCTVTDGITILRYTKYK